MIIKNLMYMPDKKLHPFVGHSWAVGKSGSGKSNTMEAIIGSTYNKFNIKKKSKKRIKFYDIFDNGRLENTMWCFAEDDPHLIKQMKLMTNGELKPKEYPTDYYMICGNNLRWKNVLPKNIILASFDESTFSIDDLFFLLGTTEAAKALLATIIIGKPNINIRDLYHYLKKYNPPINLRTTKVMLLYKIKKWFFSGMFSQQAHRLDFKEMNKDYKKITAFSTYLLDQEYEGIAYSLIMKSIFESKKMNDAGHQKSILTGEHKLSPEIMIYYREVASVLSRSIHPSYNLCKAQIEYVLRQGRDFGVDFLADTQRALDCDSWARSQFGTTIQLRSEFVDAEKLLQFIGTVPKAYLKKIPNLEVGRGMVVSGGEWEYPIQFPPAPIRHKRERSDPWKLLGDRYGYTIYKPEDYLYYEIKDEPEQPTNEDNSSTF